MTANDSKSYLPYAHKLVDQCNSSVNRNPINGDCFASTERIKTNHNAPVFKVNDRVRIIKYKNIFS